MQHQQQHQFSRNCVAVEAGEAGQLLMAYDNTATATANNETNKPPRFSTILVARENTKRPSEMEMSLRTSCQRIRVLAKLSGAHILLPGESSLALRVYYSNDVQHLEKEKEKQSGSKTSSKCDELLLKKWHSSPAASENDDIDALVAFRKAFKFTIVFFILPVDERRTIGCGDGGTKTPAKLITQMEQLNHPNSFFHRTQRIMRSATFSSYGPANSTTSKEDKMTRVFMVSDTNTAISILISVADSLTSRKRDLKYQYFKKKRELFLLPDDDEIDEMNIKIEKNKARHQSINASRRHQQQQVVSNIMPSLETAINASDDGGESAKQHTADAFREWADRFNFPDGEADVLMSVLKTLGNVVTFASNNVLDSVPIDERSKKALQSFFGDSRPSEGIIDHTMLTTARGSTATAIIPSNPCVARRPSSRDGGRGATPSMIGTVNARASNYSRNTLAAQQTLVQPPLITVTQPPNMNHQLHYERYGVISNNNTPVAQSLGNINYQHSLDNAGFGTYDNGRTLGPKLFRQQQQQSKHIASTVTATLPGSVTSAATRYLAAPDINNNYNTMPYNGHISSSNSHRNLLASGKATASENFYTDGNRNTNDCNAKISQQSHYIRRIGRFN